MTFDNPAFNELKKFPNFVNWRFEERDNKATKIPYSPFGVRKARADDPSTWGTFDQAVANLHSYDGIGFEFGDSGIIGVDLDHCINLGTGEIEPEAIEIVKALNSYTEVSVSGTGLHILCKGTLPSGGRRKGNVEIYNTGRYFTLTGDHYKSTPETIEDRTAEIAALHLKIFGPQQPNLQQMPSTATFTLDDSEILRRAFISENGADIQSLWDGDTSAYGSDDSSADIALCNYLAFWTGKDAITMDRLFRQSGLMRPKWDERRGSQTYGEKTIDKAISDCKSVYTGSRPQSHFSRQNQNRQLPRINAGIQNLAEVTEDTWKAIYASNDPVYLFRHGGVPVWLEIDDYGMPVIEALNLDRMRHVMARQIEWYKVKDDGNGTKQVDAKPPIDVVRDVLATPNPSLPILTRIVEAPIFASDGSLQTKPGYNPRGGTYYIPAENLDVPAVSPTPSEGELDFAKHLILDDLLFDFPFVADGDRANAIGMFLLPFARELIKGPTPNHLIEAPKAGNGKGLLADCLLGPAVGRNIALMPEAADNTEWEKQITAALLKGPSVINIDNINQPIKSGNLAMAYTARFWGARILGKSETVNIPVRCVWVMTANNPTMSDEIMRRSVRIRIDARQDRPWDRGGFKHEHLRIWVEENRSLLVWSALTLIRHWIASGRPKAQIRPLGSFEEWAEIIGGIMQCAGIKGFLSNLPEFYETADTEGQIWRSFVDAWWDKFGQNSVTCADLYPLTTEIDGFDFGKGSEKAQKTAFGMQLSKKRDFVVGEYRITKTGSLRRATQWQLTPASIFSISSQGSQGSPNGQKSCEPMNLCEPFNLHMEISEEPINIYKGGEGSQGSQGSHASVPAFVTSGLRQALVKVGMSEIEINALPPEIAWQKARDAMLICWPDFTHPVDKTVRDKGEWEVLINSMGPTELLEAIEKTY